MMDAIRYTTGELVRVGDIVEVRRFLRKVRGTVSWVYDPAEPSPPRGNNDYGISIRLSEKEELWGRPDKNTVLIERGAEQAESTVPLKAAPSASSTGR